MASINTTQGPLIVKYATVQKLVDAINTEQKALEKSGLGLIDIDGTPTNDNSLFGSRQKVMDHLSQKIKSYLDVCGENISMQKFYDDNQATYYCKLEEKRIRKYNYDVMIAKYDDLFNRLKILVKKYTSTYTERISSIKQTKAYIEIYETINELYTLLIEAEGLIQFISDDSTSLMCQRILFKFIEIGTGIYDYPSLFEYDKGESYAELKSAIHKRYEKLKKVSKHASPLDMIF